MDFLKIKKLHSMDGKKSIGIACNSLMRICMHSFLPNISYSWQLLQVHLRCSSGSNPEIPECYRKLGVHMGMNANTLLWFIKEYTLIIHCTTNSSKGQSTAEWRCFDPAQTVKVHELKNKGEKNLTKQKALATLLLIQHILLWNGIWKTSNGATL